MSMLSRFESRLGLTRADVTVALFTACAALTGFAYTQFFDARDAVETRRDLFLLERRHDSIMTERKNRELQELKRTIADQDSAEEWEPLTERDAELDSLAERASKPSASSGRKSLPSGPVNLNTASKSRLMSLPGVGEKTAEAIVERRSHVPFRKPEDIMSVKGIGPKKFEKMRPYIVVK